MSPARSGNSRLQPFQLAATIGAALDEDVLVEPRLRLQRDARGPVEQCLRICFGEVGEDQSLAGVVGRLAEGAVPGARKRVDVRRLERRLLQRGRVRVEVVAKDGELGRSPVAAEPMRLALCLRALPSRHPFILNGRPARVHHKYGKAGRIREGDRAACDRSARLHGVEIGEQPHAEFHAVVGVAELARSGLLGDGRESISSDATGRVGILEARTG